MFQTRPKRKKIVFTVENDIQLLSEVLIHNPYYYGSDKWTNVVSNLEEKYNLKIAYRTAKERVNNLFIKWKRDETLHSRHAGPKENAERLRLLTQVRDLVQEAMTIEQKRKSGARDLIVEVEPVKQKKGVRRPILPENEIQQQQEPEYAEDERLMIKRQRLSEADPIEMEQDEYNQDHEDYTQDVFENHDIGVSSSKPIHQPGSGPEESLEMKKLEMEHELQVLRLQNEKELKIRELELQAERERADREYRLQSLEVEKQRLTLEAENKRLLSGIMELVNKLSSKLTARESDGLVRLEEYN